MEQEIDNLNTFTHLYIMITHDCNFACEYCFNKVEDSVIPFEVAKKAIDLLVQHKDVTSNFLSITFFGGEPLLGIERIKEIKDYCKFTYQNIVWKFDITTNFSILNSLVYEEIVLDKDVSVMISLDGNKEINKRRIWKSNKQETFDVVYRNIQKTMLNPIIKNDKKFSVRATFDTSEESISHLYERFLFLSQNFGTNFVLMQVDEGNWQEVNFDIYKEQMFKIIGEIERLNNPEYYNTIKFFYDSMSSFKTRFLSLSNQMEKSCGQAFAQFAVDFTGKLSPCHRFTNIYLSGCSDYVIGDVDEGFYKDKIIKLRALDSLSTNNCKEKNCKRYGNCAFGCFASGISCSETYAPQCNGQKDILFNLFEYNETIIKDLFYGSEILPIFRTALGISTEQKLNIVMQEVANKLDIINMFDEKFLQYLEQEKS